MSERPAHTEVENPPTIASVAAVASTSDDVEAAEPTHPDRPVGRNVDTAAVGTEPGADEIAPPDSVDPVDDVATDAGQDGVDDEVRLDDSGLPLSPDVAS